MASQGERIANIEGIVSQMNERLNHVGTGLESARTEISNMRKEFPEKQNSILKWMIGITIGCWVTIIAPILTLLVAKLF